MRISLAQFLGGSRLRHLVVHFAARIGVFQKEFRHLLFGLDYLDTGRRPEDILGLPLDCLARDADGAPVLVYDNAKAHRLGRRLPVSQATAPDP